MIEVREVETAQLLTAVYLNAMCPIVLQRTRNNTLICHVWCKTHIEMPRKIKVSDELVIIRHHLTFFSRNVINLELINQIEEIVDMDEEEHYIHRFLLILDGNEEPVANFNAGGLVARLQAASGQVVIPLPSPIEGAQGGPASGIAGVNPLIIDAINYVISSIKGVEPILSEYEEPKYYLESYRKSTLDDAVSPMIKNSPFLIKNNTLNTYGIISRRIEIEEEEQEEEIKYNSVDDPFMFNTLVKPELEESAPKINIKEDFE